MLRLEGVLCVSVALRLGRRAGVTTTSATSRLDGRDLVLDVDAAGPALALSAACEGPVGAGAVAGGTCVDEGEAVADADAAGVLVPFCVLSPCVGHRHLD